MQILFLCHRVPYPPDKGDKIRAFHELRALGAHHEVDLFTLADDPNDFDHREPLLAHCRDVTIARVIPRLARLRSVPYLFTPLPLTIPYFRSARLQAAIRRAVATRHYDRVFVYCSAMAQYIDWETPPFGPRQPGSARRLPVIMDIVDVDSNKWSQYAAATAFPLSIVHRKEGRALRAYERKVCEAADCVLVTTEREARLGREIAPGARFHVVSNGVDTSYFAPSMASVAPRGRCVIFTGDMAYFPNQEAAIFFTQQVLPLIRRDVPDVRFLVVGRNPDRRVEALRGIEGVEVSGSVPDVRPWLARADAAVAPLTIAAGIQNKILEAMSSGLPIVATSRAVQGLTRPVADLIETADTPEEFARRVVRLLQNLEGAQRRGAEGRHRVAAEYNWDRSLQRVQQLVDDPHRRGDGSTPLDRHASHVGTQPAAAVRG